MITKHISILPSLALLITLSLFLPMPARSQAAPAEPLRITAGARGVHLEWHIAPESVAKPGILASISQVDIGGARLPAWLVALHVPDGLPISPLIERQASVPWPGSLYTAPAIVPQTATGELRPALALAQRRALPDSPIVVLREGHMRGARVVVLAVSPIFASGGTPHIATDLAATISGAALLAANAAELPTTAMAPKANAPGPTNAAAALPSVTLRVAEAGIQRVSGAALAGAGLNLAAIDPSNIHVRRGGVEVAIEMRIGADGRVDPADELRFYAPPPGDRWNATDTYWLTLEEAKGRRIDARVATAGNAPTRATAIELGVWRSNAIYDSLLPGSDGDHWFAADLKTAPGEPPMTASAILTPALPLASGTTTLTITGSAYTPGLHSMQVRLGAATQTMAWSETGDWSRVAGLTASSANAAVTLVPGTAPDGLELDSIAWKRPVALSFSGKGAAFSGVAGNWRYQLAGMRSDSTLYDVTDPTTPVVLAIPSGSATEFQDGPAPRQYLVSGPGTLHTPEARAHIPSNLSAPRAAAALYIAPAPFHSALAPLIAHRQSQGYQTAVIDVQAIYDAWSYGQIAPEAIRSFLRYAAATWPQPPAAVTLVGYGTSDPLNYTRHGNGNFIPPYLAMVDPRIGETACETCYAQLDGDDPLSDALPDLALGRLPAKSAAEVEKLVAKIVGYETAAGGMDWRSRAAFVADNYRDAAGGTDSAGDFAALADQVAALQPAGVEIHRLYYDPAPVAPAPWREPDAARAYARTRELLNAGAGLVAYVGHSHQWQWAVTDPAQEPSYLLGMYDADDLTNAGRLSIILELTCLTSAFQTPAFSGTTIDERLLLAGGGAIAIWGPTGLGVAHGHNALARGFLEALWSAPPMKATVGTLVNAGYLELFTTGGCCQDSLRTFALLGDPLTPARVRPAQRTFLPITSR
jgi:hypothetical protein